jgi:predicted nucleic acid-binding protein
LSFLLDTNVISELTRKRPSAKVVGWLQSVASADLFLSVISLGEIRKGIELKRARDPNGAVQLETWLQAIVLRYRSRLLGFDEEAADRWGRIMAAVPTVPIEDGQLAATALRHGLTLVTRNVRHAARTGVPHFDPF